MLLQHIHAITGIPDKRLKFRARSGWVCMRGFGRDPTQVRTEQLTLLKRQVLSLGLEYFDTQLVLLSVEILHANSSMGAREAHLLGC